MSSIVVNICVNNEYHTNATTNIHETPSIYVENNFTQERMR